VKKVEQNQPLKKVEPKPLLGKVVQNQPLKKVEPNLERLIQIKTIFHKYIGIKM
jgi:hypothetical protein